MKLSDKLWETIQEDGQLILCDKSGLIKDIVFWNKEKNSLTLINEENLKYTMYTIHEYAMKFLIKRNTKDSRVYN